MCLEFITNLNPPYNYVYFTINMMSAITSTIGNMTVMYVVITVRRLHSPSNWLLAAMASSDLVSGMVGQTVYSFYISFLGKSCIHEKIAVFISAMSCATSLLLLCFITRDRYLHVTKGLNYNNFTNNKQVIGSAFFSWLAGIFFGGLWMLEGNWQQILGFVSFAMLGFSCFVYITVTYYRLQSIVQAHFQEMFGRARNHALPASRDSIGQIQRKDISAEKASNRSVLIIIVLFAFVWFPFLVVMVICFIYPLIGRQIGSELSQAFVWSSILSFVNGAINPFIYATRYKDLGREMRKAFRCFFKNDSNRISGGIVRQQTLAGDAMAKRVNGMLRQETSQNLNIN